MRFGYLRQIFFHFNCQCVHFVIFRLHNLYMGHYQKMEEFRKAKS